MVTNRSTRTMPSKHPIEQYSPSTFHRTIATESIAHRLVLLSPIEYPHRLVPLSSPTEWSHRVVQIDSTLVDHQKVILAHIMCRPGVSCQKDVKRWRCCWGCRWRCCWGSHWRCLLNSVWRRKQSSNLRSSFSERYSVNAIWPLHFPTEPLPVKFAFSILPYQLPYQLLLI